VRPAVGIVVHDGPERRVGRIRRRRTNLGSRVLVEPELGIGFQLDEALPVELSWMHISHARLSKRQAKAVIVRPGWHR